MTVPGVPILAMTATATDKTQRDIIDSLGMEGAVVLKGSFNRPNICYSLKFKVCGVFLISIL